MLDNPVKVGEEEMQKELSVNTKDLFTVFDATLHGGQTQIINVWGKWRI